MKTLWLIARRDITEFVRTGRLGWACGLMLVLSCAALTVGVQRQTQNRAERERAQALDYDAWLKQPERHPHDAAHQGIHVFKPEVALSVLDPGITPYVGSTLWLRAHRQTEVKFRPAQDTTGLQRFGSLSFAWIVQLLGPLLVIVLGFSAIAGEREQGTLRQLMSLGVSARQLLLGKALSLVLGLCAVLSPAFGVCAGVALIAAEPAARLDVGLRLLCLALGYAVYLVTFTFIVLAVSARSASSRLACVWLLGIWIALVLVAPRLSADVSRALVPSASRREFDSHLDADVGAAAQRAWVAQFGGGTPFGPGVPLSQWGKGLQVHDRAGYSVMDQHFGRLWDSYERQQTLQLWAAWLIPTTAVRAFSMGLAGTDFAEHRAFSAAAERHRRLMQELISDDLIQHADGHGEHHFTYRASREFWAKVPRFDYASAGVTMALMRSLLSLGMLTLGLALSVIWALSAVRRRYLA